jgi:hypothetical protein
MAYQVQATVGGKIAQVGQRLIDGVAKSMSESFFKRFEEEMQRRHPPQQAVQEEAKQADATPDTPTSTAATRRSMPGWAWGAIVVVIIALVAWATQS